MRADEKSFTRAQLDVRLGELGTSGAHGFDLPALKRKSCFIALLDEVVEARLTVVGNQAGRGRGLCHEGRASIRCSIVLLWATGRSGAIAVCSGCELPWDLL